MLGRYIYLLVERESWAYIVDQNKPALKQNIQYNAVILSLHFLILYFDIHNSVFPTQNITDYPWLVVSWVI